MGAQLGDELLAALAIFLAEGRRGGRRGRRRRFPGAHGRRQVVDVDARAGGEDQGAAQALLQLADVERLAV